MCSSRIPPFNVLDDLLVVSHDLNIQIRDVEKCSPIELDEIGNFLHSFENPSIPRHLPYAFVELLVECHNAVPVSEGKRLFSLFNVLMKRSNTSRMRVLGSTLSCHRFKGEPHLIQFREVALRRLKYSNSVRILHKKIPLDQKSYRFANGASTDLKPFRNVSLHHLVTRTKFPRQDGVVEILVHLLDQRLAPLNGRHRSPLHPVCMLSTVDGRLRIYYEFDYMHYLSVKSIHSVMFAATSPMKGLRIDSSNHKKGSILAPRPPAHTLRLLDFALHKRGAIRAA